MSPLNTRSDFDPHAPSAPAAEQTYPETCAGCGARRDPGAHLYSASGQRFSGMAYTCGSGYHYGGRMFVQFCRAAFDTAAQHRAALASVVAERDELRRVLGAIAYFDSRGYSPQMTMTDIVLELRYIASKVLMAKEQA